SYSGFRGIQQTIDNMKVLALLFLCVIALPAQQAAPPGNLGQSNQQKARALIDQMIAKLVRQAWRSSGQSVHGLFVDWIGRGCQEGPPVARVTRSHIRRVALRLSCYRWSVGCRENLSSC